MNDTIAELREIAPVRRSFVKATGSLDRQIKAIARRAGGDETLATIAAIPLIDSRESLIKHRKELEKRMERMAKSLPGSAFVEETRGFGYLGLALIIGETGDLSNYPNPAKLWKRLGLAVINGKSQRKSTNKAEALIQGYSPFRRSMMYTLGDALIKQQGPYREIYLQRKAYEIDRNPEIQPMHAHRRAQRYMEKRLLRDLWRAWRNAVTPAAEPAFELIAAD